MKEKNAHIQTSQTDFKGNPLSLFEVQDFRNVQACKILPHPRFNFFYGNNAQGKTSLLEAIYFISELKSFRCQDLGSLVAHQKKESLLRAELSIHGILYDIQASLSPQGKEIYLNGKKPRPYSKLRQIIPIVLFTPDSIRLFRVSPGERRNYFDRFFCLLSESYEHCYENYQKILKQKQGLIEQWRESGVHNPSQMEVWNQELSRWGGRLTFYRFHWTQKVSEKLSHYFEHLSGNEWKVNLQYETYLKSLDSQEPEEMEKIIFQEILKRKDDEIQRGQVLVGPHRDDWALWIEGARLKEEGSQGQHRVTVAALKLSEVSLLKSIGRSPLALFDDLLSELDEQRSRQMLETLSECDCQVFLTSVTPLGLSLQGLEGLAYEVKKGVLFPVNL